MSNQHIFILDSVYQIIDKLDECSTYGMESVLDMEQALFEKGLVTSTSDTKDPGLITLESTLLDVGANPKVVQGLFYCLPLYHQGKLYLR